MPPGRLGAVWRELPFVASGLLWIPHLSDLIVGAVLFTFFASFPRRMFRSPRVWLAVWMPMALAVIRPVQYAVATLYAPLTATPMAYQGQILTFATAA